LPKRVVAVEDGSEPERQHRAGAETDAYHAGMLEDSFLVYFMSSAIVLADHDSEVSARVAEDGGSIHTLDAFQEEGTPGTGTIRECLMLGQAVCVPRHIDLSESGQRRSFRLLGIRESKGPTLNLEEMGGATTRTDANQVQLRPTAYYFRHMTNCNNFVALIRFNGAF
jgi:hypothetical protein